MNVTPQSFGYLERLRAQLEERKRRAAMDARAAMESVWRRYRTKADDGLGSRWTPGDLAAFERALIELGLRAPYGMKGRVMDSGRS
jgi:hypothetical protein